MPVTPGGSMRVRSARRLSAGSFVPLLLIAANVFADAAARAEVQIGLCAPADHIVHALDARPRGRPIDVWQFDDAALTLAARGVRLRLRVTEGGRSELTLKVADQDCKRLDASILRRGEGKCEYDAYGAGMTRTVSLTRRLNAKSTSDLLAGRERLQQVLSPSQIGYLRDVRGIWPLPPGVGRLGPMRVQLYRTPDGRHDIDISELPGGERYAEISGKGQVADVDRLRQEMMGAVTRAGVEVCADQSSQAVNKLRALQK